MFRLKLTRATFALIFFTLSAHAHNVILEFKGAYLLPTHDSFKDIYHHGSGLYGAELTARIFGMGNLYGFMGIDYFQKKGTLPKLCDSTKIMLLPITIGLKYLVPILPIVDLYSGLGFQPVCARIKNFLPFIGSIQSQWGFGGIAKVGAYIDLSNHIILDLFIDYSFAHMKSKQSKQVNALVFPKINMSGPVFGVGLGFGF